MILCNKGSKANQISHSRWWVSHQGWIANKEDYYNSCDQNKEIGNELCILVGINPELSQFLNFRVNFLLKYKMFDIYIGDRFFFDTDMFDSIQISILKYQFSI